MITKNALVTTYLLVVLSLFYTPVFSNEIIEPVVGKTIITVDVAVVATTGYRASKLLGADVYNEKGEKIGILEDFIVGADDEVSVAIISVGGFLGIGGRRVAIPTELFETNHKQQIVFPHGSKKELLSLPVFNYVE